MAKYEAFVASIRMSDYGYWIVTYSLEPGVTMSVMVCKVGISRESAIIAATGTLIAQTGRKVRQ